MQELSAHADGGHVGIGRHRAAAEAVAHEGPQGLRACVSSTSRPPPPRPPGASGGPCRSSSDSCGRGSAAAGRAGVQSSGAAPAISGDGRSSRSPSMCAWLTMISGAQQRRIHAFGPFALALGRGARRAPGAAPPAAAADWAWARPAARRRSGPAPRPHPNNRPRPPAGQHVQPRRRIALRLEGGRPGHAFQQAHGGLPAQLAGRRPAPRNCQRLAQRAHHLIGHAVQRGFAGKPSAVRAAFMRGIHTSQLACGRLASRCPWPGSRPAPIPAPSRAACAIPAR